MRTIQSIADISLLFHIASEGSFRGAARITGLSPTTIARRVKRLEHQLGIPVIQADTGKLKLAPWAEHLVTTIGAQLDPIIESIQKAQNEFCKAQHLTIDEDLLDAVPALFGAINEFKTHYPQHTVLPAKKEEAVIQWRNLSMSKTGTHCPITEMRWAIFAHRDLRYDVLAYPLFQPKYAPRIDSLRLAHFRSTDEVASCHQVNELIRHQQGLGMLPLHLGLSEPDFVEVTTDQEHLTHYSVIYLDEAHQTSAAHLGLYELILSYSRVH